MDVSILHSTAACSAAIIRNLGETDLSNKEIADGYSDASDKSIKTFLKDLAGSCRQSQSGLEFGIKKWSNGFATGWSVWDMSMISAMTNCHQKNVSRILRKLGFRSTRDMTSVKNGIEVRFWMMPIEKLREKIIEHGFDPEDFTNGK